MSSQPIVQTPGRGLPSDPSLRPFTTSLPIGDLQALGQLGLQPVGVVQGFQVVRLRSFEKFHRLLGFLNRGLGYRPGTADAYFGSIYGGKLPASIGTPQSRAVQLKIAELIEAMPLDPAAERRHLSLRVVNQMGWNMYRGNASNISPTYLTRLRNYGIERFSASALVSNTFPGMAFEQGEVIQGFTTAYEESHTRLREQARDLGAHGVIGVVDSIKHVAGSRITEFHLTGTAVKLRGEAPSDSLPWTTYLTTQQLSKLIEIGLMPVEIVMSLSSVLLVTTGYGNWLRSGQMAIGSNDLPELRALQELALSRARQRAYSSIGADSLHGVVVTEQTQDRIREVIVQECLIKGTRVHRFKQADPLSRVTSTMGLL